MIPLYRLGPLGLLILLFRRIPFIFAVRKEIRQIEGLRQAGYVGFFGPIGVSAIFYLYVSLQFLEGVTVNETVRPDAIRLGQVMRVVIWFLAVCSIVVHGLSVPIGKLGYHLPRQMSRALSTSPERNESIGFPLTQSTRHSASQQLRQRRPPIGRPLRSTYRLDRTSIALQDKVHGSQTNGEPDRPIRFIDTPAPNPHDQSSQTPAERQEERVEPTISLHAPDHCPQHLQPLQPLEDPTRRGEEPDLAWHHNNNRTLASPQRSIRFQDPAKSEGSRAEGTPQRPRTPKKD